jgi:hypothetical protein
MKTWVCKGEVSHGCGGGARVVDLKKASAKFEKQVAKARADHDAKIAKAEAREAKAKAKKDKAAAKKSAAKKRAKR